MKRNTISSPITFGFLFLAMAGTVFLSGCQRIQSGEARSSTESGTMPPTSQLLQSDLIPSQLPDGTSRSGPQSTPIITLSITPTVALLPTPTSSPPAAILLQNTNCRIGPGADYRILATLLKSTMVPIIGQDPYRAWWLVRVPAGVVRCWIAMKTGQATGDTSGVPVVQPPPLGCLVKGNNHIDECLIPCPPDVQTEGVCSP